MIEYSTTRDITTTDISGPNGKLIIDFENCLRASDLPVRPTMLNAINALKKYMDEHILDISITIDPDASIAIQRKIVKWVAPKLDTREFLDSLHTSVPKVELLETANGKLRLQLFSLKQPVARIAGKPASAIHFYVLQPKSDLNTRHISLIESNAKSSPINYIILCSKSRKLLDRYKALISRAIYSRLYQASELPNDSPLKIFTMFSADNLLSLLNKNAVVSGMLSLSSATELAVARERRNLLAKRKVLPTIESTTRHSSGREHTIELMKDMRSGFQSELEHFESYITEHFDTVTNHKTGSLWEALSTQIDSLVELSRTEQTKSTILSLPPSYQEEFIRLFRIQLLKHCTGDVSYTNQLLSTFRDKIELTLSTSGITPFEPQFQPLADVQLHKVLNAHVEFEREYQGEIPRRGIMEYIYGARRYQIVFYMLIPLASGSFLGTFRTTIIQLSIGLLAIGIIATIRSVRKERIETNERELAKSKEFLSTEARKIYSATKRSWIQFLVQNMRAEISAVLGKLEQHLRSQKRTDEIKKSEDDNLVRRQHQALDKSLVKIESTAKQIESIKKHINGLQGELRAALKASLDKIEQVQL